MSHVDRVRAESFGADAERYERTRPRYPGQLLTDLVGGRPRAVLDVGCGTGIVGEALLERGCRVVGVEPDPRMAAIARRKGIPVEIATFEQWHPGGRKFDLVVSGQAWHWVEPVAGAEKAAAVLPAGGRLAVFWNLGHHDEATQTALDSAYALHAPALLRGPVALGRVRGAGAADAIRASGRFGAPEVRRYRWEQRYSVADWLDQLPTHSDHRLLPKETLAALLDEVAGVLYDLGGEALVGYETLLITAQRTAEPAGEAAE